MQKAARAFGVDAGVKWPNDVWVGDQKMAGVLADSQVADDDRANSFLLLGIGINVNGDMSTGALGRSATSMRACLQGADIEREAFLAGVCNELESIMGMPHKSVVDEYRRLDVLTGRECVVMPHKLEDASSHYQAYCIGVNDDGNMQVRVGDHPDTVVLSCEEVSVRPYLDALQRSAPTASCT